MRSWLAAIALFVAACAAGSSRAPSSAAEDQAQPDRPGLDRRIKKKFGEHCSYDRSCKGVVGVDCGAAVDGLYIYAQRRSLRSVATCGGITCSPGPCPPCPPVEWECEPP